ncbi:MAG: Gfo/Idh/MocA family oxidoreductase [Deltaproteobacteria bacterium]|nr:Gfo/Idh/MocA family oxidoreductase [Deltaproteobacteria bacterium]
MSNLKTAVIGVGYLGRFHAEKYSKLENSELVAVVDPNTARAEEIAKEFSTKAYSDYKDLLGKVDCVSIVTPTESHATIGMDFIKSGTHVLIEKPITKTAKEAEDLIAEAEKQNVILQVGHLERFNPAVVALKDKVKNPVFIESHRLSPFPNRATDVDVVLDLMIHDIDIILNLVADEVESVDATGIPVISGKVDIANARIKFKNGCVANVTASRISKETLRRIRLFQPDAYISIDYAEQKINLSSIDRGKEGLPQIKEEEITIERKDMLFEEIKSFLECIENGSSPIVSGHDGKRALDVAARIQVSVEKSLQQIFKNIKSGS